ncbi:PQQ-binding-like beta-propeller repeat protein [Anatilimnocola sp. NA78]|uniref:PQQ-binding-like beta-propeller repeat protein n=1 Tax=Anatilimnocola sp. NA78 TaxID=3415683 RepID=UPI003CE5A0A8
MSTSLLFTIVTVAICLALIPLLQIYVDEIQTVIRVFDGAAANMASWLLAFIAFCTAWTWFSWFSHYSLGSRRAVSIAPVVFAIIAMACLRFEGVDGYMKPSFVPRWYPIEENSLDQAPASLPTASVADSTAPATETGGPGIDLTTETTADFAQFLGPTRSNWVPDTQLASDWKENPPREVWKHNVGPGWAGFAVRNGYAVTMEQRGPDEWITCYRVADGELVWHHAAPGRHDNPLGGLGPRSTPTIHEGRVYAQGATGLVRCLDGATGKLLWEDDLLKRYGLTQSQAERKVQWGRSGSALIVNNLVVFPAGGEGKNLHSLIAYDRVTGEVVWEAGDDQISYASPVFAKVAGVDQIVAVNEVTLAGYDPQTGKELWRHDWQGNSSGDANVSQAFPLDGDRLFISKGYGQGSSLLKINADGDKLSAETVWASRRVLKTKFTNVTIIGEHAYGLSDGVLECVEIATGKSRWRSGRYGHGQVLGVGQQLIVLSEDGELVLVAANPEKAEVRGKFQAIEGKTWNNLCLSGKLLLVRNGQEAACFELP